MISEIPLLYAGKAGRCLRYRVQENGTLERIDNSGSARSVGVEYDVDLNHLVGCSSISTLDENSFVATLPQGRILTVTLVEGCHVHRRVEFEFLESVQSPITKVHCFADENDDTLLTLLVADAKACIYTIVLERDTMTPSNNATYTTTDVAQILEDMDMDYSGAELHTTMVDFVSPTTAIVALSPFLLTVDIPDQYVFIWSETQVRESMAVSVTSILNRAGSMLLGRVDDGAGMAPVAAISCATGGHIVSLHADATVRHWVLDTNSFHPLQVYSVPTPQLPQDWVTSLAAPFSFAVTARVYGQKLGAVVHIHSKSQGSTLCLIQTNTSSFSHTVTPLVLPDEVDRVLVLSLQAETPQLVVVGTEKISTANATHYTHLVYPFSFRGLIETTPIVASVDYTLDGVAEEELHRLLALSGEGMEEDDVDHAFLKHIFRPSYPRATATTTGPSRAAVEAAISKHVQGGGMSLSNKSLELQVLLAMQQWRRTEQQQSRNATTGDSVYDAYGDDNNMQDDETPDNDTDAHLRRWRAFCKTIWDYEAHLRYPLRVDTLSHGQIVLMRSSTMSVLVEGADDEPFDETMDGLDAIALELLTKVEHEKQSALATVETAATQVVTSLSLVMQPDEREEVNEIKTDLQQLGLWAADKSVRLQTQKILKTMTPSKLMEYLDRAPAEVMLPGLSSLVVVAGDDPVMAPEVRHAAAGLVVRGVDAMRRLVIGRCLVLLGHFESNEEIQNLVLAKYLHTLAALYTLAQHVPMPVTTPRPFGESPPPKKRLSFGDDHAITSILPDNSQMTTALDAHILQASVSSSGDLPKRVLTITKTILQSTFGKARKSRLPELGCLAAPSKDDVASDYPRLALRLLAAATLSDQTNVARTEAIAECLLIESNHCTPDMAERMRLTANSLLDPVSLQTQEVDPEELGATYESLVAAAQKRVATEDVMQAEDAMMTEVQRLLYGYVDGEIRQDVRRLCEKETTRVVFLQFFLSGGLPRFNAQQQAQVKSLLQALLRLSNLMNRLSIIERRTDRLGRLGDSSSLNLVSQTKRTIRKIQQIFPETIYESLPEYIHLWSLLFRHAEAACEWNTAYNACINNPNPERRSKNFDQLVKGMVDAGAMGELLDLCSSVAATEQDLYEIAATALAGDMMSLFTGATADSLSCLYCLFANNDDWKRAAQAMDMRFGSAEHALASSSSAFNNEAAEQVAMSAIGCYIAIKLVSDPADAYLVAGEVGPYIPSIAFMEDASVGEQEPKSILKRGRDRVPPSPGGPASNQDDRLSRFMTGKDILARAVRSMAFETMYKATTTEPIPASVLSQSNVDMTIIDKLASAGYYSLAFLLAKARQMTLGIMPNGRDIVHDAYSHVLCNYLVAVASQGDQVASAGSDDMETEEDSTKRPTMAQLEYTLNQVNHNGLVSSSIVGPRYGSTTLLAKTRLGSAAMELIRQIVLQERKDAPLALEVAESFLATSNAQLPQWLKEHLAGHGNDGLFGKNGDPSALCSLYMRHGRYVDACNLVSQVLEGTDDRKTKAATRVPERGSMDFVPYPKIDLLWNLVDRALRQGSVDESVKSQLRVSRLRMEQSLEFHFNLLKISEQGLKSARALARE